MPLSGDLETASLSAHGSPQVCSAPPSWLPCPLQAAGLGLSFGCQPNQATLPDTLRQGEGALHCRLWSHYPLPLTRYSGPSPLLLRSSLGCSMIEYFFCFGVIKQFLA